MTTNETWQQLSDECSECDWVEQPKTIDYACPKCGGTGRIPKAEDFWLLLDGLQKIGLHGELGWDESGFECRIQDSDRILSEVFNEDPKAACYEAALNALRARYPEEAK